MTQPVLAFGYICGLSWACGSVKLQVSLSLSIWRQRNNLLDSVKDYSNNLGDYPMDRMNVSPPYPPDFFPHCGK